MGGCHIWCKHKEIQTNRCYFLCSVVLQYIFFYFCCLNERNIVVLIFHHQRPLDPFHPVCSRWMLHNSGLFFFPFCYSALVFACPFSTHPLTDRRGATAVIISRFCGPHRNVGMRRGGQGGAVGSVYRSKDAAFCCRDNGCNIKTVGLIHDGAAASAVRTLRPKFLSVEKSESKVARRQQPKNLLVSLCFFPSIVIALLFKLCTLCAYDH